MPECCDFIGENQTETIDLSEGLDGQTVREYKNLANENNIWLSIGSIHEALYNTVN